MRPFARSMALAAAAALAGLPHGAPGAAAAPGAASVTFLAGEAARVAPGRRAALAPGSLVRPGDVVETGSRTRLELELPDGSFLRVGPRSRVELAAAVFGRTAEERRVSARLLGGSLWAKVTRAVGGDARFEVQTENAVAGVRGTTFRVDARRDRSCVVKVYSGAVAVAGRAAPRPAHETGGGGERRQVPGPGEVTRAEWERIVGRMMQVAVAPDGTPGEPTAFALAAPGQDAWEEWNRERDAAR